MGFNLKINFFFWRRENFIISRYEKIYVRGIGGVNLRLCNISREGSRI